MLKIKNEMIQRIQTIYLLIAMLLLAFVTVGVDFFSFVSEEFRYNFNVYGIQKVALSNNEIAETTNYPIYISTICLILLAFITMMSFKSLDRQFKLGRTLFGLYFVFLIALIIFSFIGDTMIEEEVKREMGLGFFLFASGFPFTFLANTGIKRDKKLLNSLDRLR